MWGGNTENDNTEIEVLKKSLSTLENKIRGKLKENPTREDIENYENNYFDILRTIEIERENIDSINLKIKIDKIERRAKDYNKSLDNDIKQNLKNMVLYGIIMLVCGILIILISIDSPVSYGILGIIISGSFFMLYINYVRYRNNKSYKSGYV